MRPVEIRIAGSYYDSQIYSGSLYLWSMEGDILRIDWDRLIDSVEVQASYRSVLEFAFRRSEYLYDPNVAILLHDREIRSVLQKRFLALSNNPIEIPKALLERCVIAKYGNRFGFPHADSGFYFGNLFVGSREGVEFSWPDALEDGHAPNKVTDLPALGIALGSGRLAVAAGDEGAYQLTTYPQVESDLRQVMPNYTNWVRWMERALFASDRSALGTFVDFKSGKKRKDSSDKPPERVVRQLVPIAELRKLHEKVEYVWGAEDRVCIASSGHISVLKFFPRRKLDERFEFLGTIEAGEDQPHDFVSADNAVFGFVLEHQTALKILESSSETTTLNGEPVNWRVFPRSKYYTNHLHVVRDEHLSVFSFNADFFVNQANKISGVEFKRNVGFGRKYPKERPEPVSAVPFENDELNEL